MNKYIAVIILSAMAVTAPAADKKKKSSTPPPPAIPVVQPLVIPKDATPNPDGSYSYSDSAGKKWIYRKTPFGISKIDDMSGQAPAIAAPAPGQYVKAFDNGETVRFERQSPFGTTKWEKKKSELTDEERGILERQAPPSEQKPE